MHAEVPSHPIFNSVAVSSTNTYYSGDTAIAARAVPGNAIGSHLGGALSFSAVGKFTSTPNGTLTIEVSDSSDAEVMAGTDIWITYDRVNNGGFTAGVATVTSGQISSSATFGISLAVRFLRIRLKYVNASSSGTIFAEMTVKRY